jgi:hypothetical protein
VFYHAVVVFCFAGGAVGMVVHGGLYLLKAIYFHLLRKRDQDPGDQTHSYVRRILLLVRCQSLPNSQHSREKKQPRQQFRRGEVIL